MSFSNNSQLFQAIEASESFYRSLAPRRYLLENVVNQILPKIQLMPLGVKGTWSASITGPEVFPKRDIPQATYCFRSGPRQISFYLPLPAEHVKEEAALLFAQDLIKGKDHTQNIQDWNEYEVNGDIDFQLESKYL